MRDKSSEPTGEGDDKVILVLLNHHGQKKCGNF